MKKTLLLIVLLIVVIAVSARLPQRSGKHGPKKPQNGCQLQNCRKCHSKPFSCDECDYGFLREKVPLGYACRKTCSPGLYSVQGTCVEKQDDGWNFALTCRRASCTANCKLCQGRSCSVCERGRALYKGFHQRGRGVCIKKCPPGHKAKVNPAGGNECVRHCTANCKLCQDSSCSVCEHGHVLYKGFRRRGRGVCIKKCPLGYKAKENHMGGNECVRHCTSNCKTCQGIFCSVCEQGHALYKGFGGLGNGRCLRKCPKGYKTGVNPSGGNKCVRSCEVAQCESCPRGWTHQPYKCDRCESGFYRLSVRVSWEQYDFCFSHCPTGYGSKNVKGVAQCQKEPETKSKAITEPITMPEVTATTEAEPTPSGGPTSEPETTPSGEPTGESGRSTTSEPSTTPESMTEPEPVTEPEPTTVFTDFWP